MDQEQTENMDYKSSSLDTVYQSAKLQQVFKPGERKQLIEEKIRYLEGAAMAMQNDLVSWQKKYAKFFKESLELYQALNKPDTLFDDSPLSRHTMNRWIRLFLIKKNMAFIAKETHWFDSPDDIPDFLQKVKELKLWALRFANDDAPEKSGEELILSKGVK